MSNRGQVGQEPHTPASPHPNLQDGTTTGTYTEARAPWAQLTPSICPSLPGRPAMGEKGCTYPPRAQLRADAQTYRLVSQAKL